MPHSFKDLTVWKRFLSLVRNIYKLTASFPNEERFGLTTQLRRCAVFIPSNIAEGQGRLAPAEFRQFLSNARGSLMELETQIIIASSLNFLPLKQMEEISDEIEQIAKILNALITAIRARSN